MGPANEVIGVGVPGGTLAVELTGPQQEPVLASGDLITGALS